METRAFRWLAAILLLVFSLGVTACGGTRRPHYARRHNHEYRHGYYNPVDGYFHDDHWHNHKHYRGCGHAVSYHYY